VAKREIIESWGGIVKDLSSIYSCLLAEQDGKLKAWRKIVEGKRGGKYRRGRGERSGVTAGTKSGFSCPLIFSQENDNNEGKSGRIFPAKGAEACREPFVRRKEFFLLSIPPRNGRKGGGERLSNKEEKYENSTAHEIFEQMYGEYSFFLFFVTCGTFLGSGREGRKIAREARGEVEKEKETNLGGRFVRGRTIIFIVSYPSPIPEKFAN